MGKDAKPNSMITIYIIYILINIYICNIDGKLYYEYKDCAIFSFKNNNWAFI